MKDLIVTIDRDTRKVKLNRGFIGLNGENLQGDIIVDFTDKGEFVDGTAYFEVVQDGKPYALEMAQDGANKAYKLPIKSSLLTHVCELVCQVVIRQAETADGVPVFKSCKFKLPCLEAINATETIPEQYPPLTGAGTKWYKHLVVVRTLDGSRYFTLVSPVNTAYTDIKTFGKDCLLYGAIFDFAQGYTTKVTSVYTQGTEEAGYEVIVGFADDSDGFSGLAITGINNDAVMAL